MLPTTKSVLALLLTLLAPCVPAAEPIYFRSDFGVPRDAGSKLPVDLNDTNVLVWRTPLDSGHSTPIHHGGQIFLTTSQVKDNRMATVAVDAATGHVLWAEPVEVPKIEEYHPEEGNAAMATPATDGERLYAFFGSYGLICYDLKTHKKIWEHRVGPFRDEYGAASSPVLLDGKVILNEDHDIDSFLIAFDSATGRVLWKTPRPDAVRSYATPAVWSNDGRKELLVAGALELAGYDPENGQKLWWLNGLARIVIPTPLPSRNTIYMASWAPGGDASQRLTLDKWDRATEKWDRNKDQRLTREEIPDREVLNRFFRMDLNQDGSLDESEWNRHAEVFQRAQNALLAVKPHGRGQQTDGAVAWKYSRGVPYVASPMLHNGIVWMVKDGGLVTKLDALTGDAFEQERLGATGNYYASPVAAGGNVYFASEPGVVSVVADQREWRLLGSRKFDEKIYATPLVLGDRLYIRTERALYCFSLARTTSPRS